ncbi:ABC transporter substrate-binding protein [Cohnella hashimotonis]|uniref:Extracellular solute-binding protein n=1 Tax=Cohnella hashimotonis TaxID=2826895 RepID=A0ABT6TKH8_9BACL|nr:extracellular solute-binding protein [Cohnella hashimotonis]MDI4647358.1 extracellular solute-binding protein [Cohnella hashimotonis]
MANKRKLSVSLGLILALSTTLAACGGNNNNNAAGESAAPSGSAPASSAAASESAAPAKDPVELTFMGPTSWMAGSGVQDMLKAYEAATGNKIKQEVVPDDQYLNVMKTKMSTNDAPDLLFHNKGFNYIPANFLEPITGPILDRIDPTVAAVTTIDGKFYQAPVAPHSFYGVIYNTEVFDKAGIKVPLKTYQEFIAAADKLLAMGVTPLGLAGKSTWTANQPYLVGGAYVFAKNPDLAKQISTNKIKPADSPEYLEMINRYVSLKKYIAKDYLSSDQPIIQKGLLDGTIAMEFYPDVTYGDFEKEDKAKAEKLGYMPFTLGDDYIAATFPPTDEAAMSIPVNAKHKAEANDFINFATQKDNFILLNTKDGTPGSGISPYKDFTVGLNHFQQSMADMIAANNIPAAPFLLGYLDPNFQLGDFNKHVNDMMAGKAPAQALDDWYKDYAKVNKAAKTEGF